MHFWGNVKWGSHCGNSLEDPQNLNIESPYAQAILLWVQIKKKGMQGLEERFAHPHSQQCDSQQPEGGNTPAVHELRDE